MFCHILLWIRPRVSFLNTGFRESTRNWEISVSEDFVQKQHNSDLEQFLRVIKEHSKSKHLNSLKICFIYCLKKCLHFCTVVWLCSLTKHGVGQWHTESLQHLARPRFISIFLLFHLWGLTSEVPRGTTREAHAWGQPYSASSSCGSLYTSHTRTLWLLEFGLQWSISL